MEYFIYLDLLGTLVFAITGAFRAVKHELDILGVVVLSIFTGVGGGILRDIIIGRTPPSVFQNELYLIICIVGGLLVFIAAPKIAESWPVIKIGDAIGLGVFAVLGSWKGIDAGLGPIGVILIGTLSAVGGGVIRDVLVLEVPAVIRTDFYATAAALGSLIFFIFIKIGVPLPITSFVTLIVTSGVRILAMIYKINLPRVKRLPDEPSVISKIKSKK